jgi:hypothetical protein
MSADTSERVINPGDVTIAEAVILNSAGAGVNVKRIIVQLDLYEDLMTPFVTG